MKHRVKDDLPFITAYGGSHAPYRRALLKAFDEHADLTPEDRFDALLELVIHRMGSDCTEYCEYLAGKLYRMADALAVKGPK
jgi:hypothetical protein